MYFGETNPQELSMQRRSRSAARRAWVWAALASAGTLVSSQSAVAQAVPPAPTPFFWPERTFEPGRQCSGKYAVADLERFLPMANIALQIPSTEQVTLDSGGHCIRIAVRGIGTGRLVELVLRGMAIPRRAVLLELREPPKLRHG
jgi:hypothetical protein